MGMIHVNDKYALNISEPRIKYRSTFVVELSYMSGDADFYEQDEQVLKTVADVGHFLDAVEDLYRLNRNRRDRWNATDLRPESYAYFGIMSVDEFNAAKTLPVAQQDYDVKYSKDYPDYLENVEIDWPRDKSCDDCGRAAFDGYTLYWYDEDGKQAEVQVVDKVRVL